MQDIELFFKQTLGYYLKVNKVFNSKHLKYI